MQAKNASAPAAKKGSSPVPFTAMVVTYNEAARLRECLEGLAFCEQLVVCDLGSEDRSVEIAHDCGAEVIHHERMPTVEQVREQIVHHARHDWIIFVDPDEVWAPELTERVREEIETHPRLAQVKVPWQFYFKSEPLRGTRWGGPKHKGVLFHRHRCDVTDEIYRGVQPHDEFEVAVLPWDGTPGCLRHYWMDSYQQLFEKHWRYVKRAGEVKYQNGERFAWRAWLRRTAASFKRCLLDEEGWREGGRGLFLSAFWSAFTSASLLSLYHYEHHPDRRH